MEPRQITTLMHRLFYGDIPDTDGWAQLMVNGELNAERVNSLINRYIKTENLLLFVNSQHCAYTLKSDAFEHTKKLILHGTVRIADPQFHARILISQIGVGVGSVL
jgi:hypothetical protein